MKQADRENEFWEWCQKYFPEQSKNVIRQYQFWEATELEPKKRRWRADFAFPDYRLIVEIQGISFRGKGTRHQRGVGMMQDYEKLNYALLLGWKVVLVAPPHFKKNQDYWFLYFSTLFLRIQEEKYGNP